MNGPVTMVHVAETVRKHNIYVFLNHFTQNYSYHSEPVTAKYTTETRGLSQYKGPLSTCLDSHYKDEMIVGPFDLIMVIPILVRKHFEIITAPRQTYW